MLSKRKPCAMLCGGVRRLWLESLEEPAAVQKASCHLEMCGFPDDQNLAPRAPWRGR